MGRATLLQEIAEGIVAAKRDCATRVAIDGIDGSGKTTLANELALILAEQGERVIRASTDGFHNPKPVRYALGPLSAEGYYRDSFNLEAFIISLLTPLGPGGDRHYQSAIYDVRSETRLDMPLKQAPAGAILLFDGIFLARPELVAFWDLFIFVETSFYTCLLRAVERDQALFGSVEEVLRRYQARYLPAQRLYLDSCRPVDRADFVLHNDDPTNPRLTLHPPPGRRPD